MLRAIAADPAAIFSRAARGQRQPGRRRGRVLARLARGARPARPARPPRARPPGGADPRPLRRPLDGDPARGPLPADRGRRRRLRPRRQDRARRRRPAGVRRGAPRPPPSTRSPRPRSRGTPTCRSTELATPDREADRARRPTRTCWPKRRAWSTTRSASTASDPRRASSPSPRRCGPAARGAAVPRPRARRDAAKASLTDEQWAAVRGAFASRISVLTGGPGVGKTVCTKAIVAEAEAADARIALCAPTGRAARRLEEATGHEAQTIHRLLEWMPGREPGLRARPPAAGRPGDRRRVLDAQPAPGRGAARRARRDDPRRLRRRRRPAAADRRRQAVRRPDRLRDRAGRPAQPDLPPGGALDDHHRRPRDQRRPARPTSSPRPTRTTTSSSSSGPPRSGPWRPSSRSSPSGCRSASACDPIRDVQVLAPMYQGRGRDRRPQRAPPGAAQPGRRAGARAGASGSATA